MPTSSLDEIMVAGGRRFEDEPFHNVTVVQQMVEVDRHLNVAWVELPVDGETIRQYLLRPIDVNDADFLYVRYLS